MAKKNKQVPRNDLQYEQLASEYLIKATPKLDEYSLVAHNLYNRALFDLRQGFLKRNILKAIVNSIKYLKNVIKSVS